MSFFSSLQQYVTSGVAGLGLSPRRFSLSRQESVEPPQEKGNSTHVHGKYFYKFIIILIKIDFRYNNNHYLFIYLYFIYIKE